MRNMLESDDSARISETSFEDHMLIPGMLGFKSAHTLINRERCARGLCSLNRSRFLDRLAQLHAQAIAQDGQLAHSADSADDLKDLVGSLFAGENIQRGPCVEDMHKESMRAGKSAYKNLLGKKFREFGLGTALGADKKLYMVQLFRGKRLDSRNEAVEQQQQALAKEPSQEYLREHSVTFDDETGRPESGHGIGSSGEDEASSSSDHTDSEPFEITESNNPE